MASPSYPAHPRPAGTRRFRKPLNGGLDVPTRHGWFQGHDGTRLFYCVEGEGPPLVFCYGMVCSSLHWTYQIQRLSTRHQAVWFDYRGHQNSETPADLSTLTIPSIAKDLGCLFDELKLPPAVLLGHSMGVNVVLEFYRQRPRDVAGMVLANGTAKRPLETLLNNTVIGHTFTLLSRLHDLSPRLFRGFWRNYLENPVIDAIVGIGGFNPHLTPPEDIRMYVKQISQMDPLVLLNLVANYDSYDATAWLHTIDKPTLILAGENDDVIPPAQQELLHQLIPGSRLATLAHASHCSQMDLPETVNAIIEEFLERAGISRRAEAEAASPSRESASPTTPPSRSRHQPSAS
ncbi:MAG: alpha/beta hydrolase [Bdellovibrionales bacterium]|nr:alpha/beta hydrolase [Bdellovibrionales bacterium]